MRSYISGHEKKEIVKRTLAALERLNQNQLSRQTINNPSIEGRPEVFKKLKDSFLLEKVALSFLHDGISDAVIDRLDYQKLLHKLVKRKKIRKNSDLYIEIVKMLKDQEVIAQIAKKDTDWRVRQIAIRKLESQDVLAKFALSDVDADIRKTAAETLTNQEVLAIVALCDRSTDVRKIAVNKLTSQEVLVMVTRSDVDAGVRLSAVRKLENQKALAKVALCDANEDVRKTAVDVLTSQEVLAEVVLSGRFKSYQLNGALGKIIDQSLLFKIAQTSNDPYIRKPATCKLTSMDQLESIALMDMDEMVAEKAVRRLARTDAIRTIAHKAKLPNARYYALDQLDWEDIVQLGAEEALMPSILARVMREKKPTYESIRPLLNQEVMEEICAQMCVRNNESMEDWAIGIVKEIYIQQPQYQDCIGRDRNWHHDEGDRDCNTHNDRSYHFDAAEL